jgi:NADH-quinone oxidoreductase subunit D
MTDLKTETVTINMGPQHPSTHGVFRLVLTMDGETVVDVEPVVGYLHRNHEKIGEKNNWIQNTPFTDRLDYISPMSNEFAYVLAVEKLAEIEPPERAKYIRIIMVEMNRIVNHMVAIAFLMNELGCFFTPMMYCLRWREMVLDMWEMTAGSRMMPNYFWIGGVAADLPPEFLPQCREFVDAVPGFTDELEGLITDNEIVQMRCKNVGVLPPDVATAYGSTGPLLRASGVPYDIRRAEPYSIYDRFDFDIPVGTVGDVYDRYLVRIAEIRQSVRILEQALRDLPEGETATPKKKKFVPPAGDVYHRIEAPKGELGFYLVSDGDSSSPYRYKIRAPSFVNLQALPYMCRGGKIADVVVVIGSIDLTMGEVDR